MTEYSKEPSFKETGLVSVITEFAFALTAFRGETWWPSGTAIVIGPYFAITAKHVIEDYWNRYEKAQSKAKIGERVEAAGTFHILACQILERGRTGALWSVTRLWYSPFTDVAFLRLTPWAARLAPDPPNLPVFRFQSDGRRYTDCHIHVRP